MLCLLCKLCYQSYAFSGDGMTKYKNCSFVNNLEENARLKKLWKRNLSRQIFLVKSSWFGSYVQRRLCKQAGLDDAHLMVGHRVCDA